MRASAFVPERRAATVRLLFFGVLRCCALLAPTAFITGCGLVFDYPKVVAEATAARCADGRDNDLDGDTDCSDRNCSAHCSETSHETCHDGRDNDLDGRADCKVASCERFCHEADQAWCSDGIDNDADGDQDCRDEECADFCPEASASTCSDGEDNDSDSDVDCNDVDCEGFCPEETPGECSDDLDNDGDGLADTADPRCWLHAPPHVRRCASVPGTELVEHFDAFSLYPSSRWSAFGGRDTANGYVSIADGAARRGVGRADRALQFAFNTTESDALERNLGGIILQPVLAGAWGGIELSFGASVPLDSAIRIGIVPAELAFRGRPFPGAESSLFSLAIDAAHAPPELSLEFEGARISTPLPECGDIPCGDDFSRVEVGLDDEGFVVRLEHPSGEVAELRAPGPTTPSLPPARLVIWGGSTDAETATQLDDLRLKIASNKPCGFDAPQIPEAVCEASSDLQSFGQTVGLARGEPGYCALVGAARELDTLEPAALTAWRSDDGALFTAASSSSAVPIELPASSTPLGAGLAYEDGRWLAAVVYRGPDGVALGLTSSADCGSWDPLLPGPTLPPDAEPPSYVVVDGQHRVYFTRPPTDQIRRSLWRASGPDPSSIEVEAELIAELPAGVGAPVSLRRVGTTELVLSYPTLPGVGQSGAGLLVGDLDGRVWDGVKPEPLLSVSGTSGFDETSVISAALDWDESGGFFFYGGLSSHGIAVGTAELVLADASFSRPSERVAVYCGDRSCDAREACETCPADCQCAGVEQLTNGFDGPPALVSSSEIPQQMLYVHPETSALNWAAGTPTWAVIPLARAVSGDFELAFDLTVDPVADLDLEPFSCRLYMGLGATPNLTADEHDGIFARISYRYCAAAEYYVDPFVRAGGETFAESAGVTCRTPGASRRFTLRKTASEVSVRVAADDGCGIDEQRLPYLDALMPLPALLIGFGGSSDASGFQPCPANAAGSISNVSLRLLDDPNDCPDGKRACALEGGEPACFDTSLSPLHCGACGNACNPGEACQQGECVCTAQSGFAKCGDDCAVDLSSSPEHCGECFHACDTSCVSGSCDVGTECESALTLASESVDPLAVDFSTLPEDPIEICEAEADRALFMSWTAPRSGEAFLLYEFEGPAGQVSDEVLVAVGDDLTCSSWLKCDYFTLFPAGYGELTFDVEEGTEYRIVLATPTGNAPGRGALSLF
jgi:hypothetical protein